MTTRPEDPPSPPSSPSPPAAARRPWTAPRLRALPVGATETGGAAFDAFDFPSYRS